MGKEQPVIMESVKGNENEYIIKDTSGITVGRAYIIELFKSNKYCSLRIKLYKSYEESYIYLKGALNLLMKTLFNNMEMNKISVFVDEETNISPLIELGFELEGIITNSIAVSKERISEFVFGISFNKFEGAAIDRKITIKGSNIEIRLLTPENAVDVYEYYIRNKEYLRPFEPLRDEEFYTLPYHRKNLIEEYRQFLNGRGATFGIYRNNSFIGKIRISNIVEGVFKSAIIGYSIDKNEQGKGYMKEAVRLVCDFAYEDLELHRLEASTLVSNLKSQSVLRGCGFKELGLNEKYLFINGEWSDHLTFYKTNEEL